MSDDETENTTPACESEDPLANIGDPVPDPFEHPADVDEDQGDAPDVEGVSDGQA